MKDKPSRRSAATLFLPDPASTTGRVRLGHRKNNGYPAVDIMAIEASLATPPPITASCAVLSAAQDLADHWHYYARPGGRPVRALAHCAYARLRHIGRGFCRQRHRARFQRSGERIEHARPDHQRIRFLGSNLRLRPRYAAQLYQDRISRFDVSATENQLRGHPRCPWPQTLR